MKRWMIVVPVVVIVLFVACFRHPSWTGHLVDYGPSRYSIPI
jgi:hypothetical protein